jgi:hypothetical protein
MKNKKATNFITGTVMFIIINILFFSIIFLYVSNIGSKTNSLEQIYSKKIALVIDNLERNTEINISILEITSEAEKNKFYGEILSFDCDKGIVTVYASPGGGYSYYFFTKINQEDITLDRENKILSIKT